MGHCAPFYPRTPAAIREGVRMTVTNALIQKAQNHLNQLIRYRNKVMTNREFIVTLLAKGYTPECYAISKVAVPTGRQINRWDNDQYRQHWMKRAKSGTKIEYILKTSNNFLWYRKLVLSLHSRRQNSLKLNRN